MDAEDGGQQNGSDTHDRGFQHSGHSIDIRIRIQVLPCMVMPRPEEHLSPDRPLASGEAERIAERMAAFATASRLKLLYALVNAPGTVDELAARTGLTNNAVSQ